MAVMNGVRGGAIGMGGFGRRRSWKVQSASGRVAVTFLGLLLMFIGAGQLLGYEDRLGITTATKLIFRPAGADLLLIAVGLLFLVSAIFVKSYVRAEDGATGVLSKVPANRLVVFVRILALGVSIVLLASGVWDLVHDLSQ